MVTIIFKHFCFNFPDTRSSVVLQLFEGHYDFFLGDRVNIADGGQHWYLQLLMLEQGLSWVVVGDAGSC